MALLSTHGLTAQYGQFKALFGIDLHVDPGECVAIIGANGAGKTTLMRSITGVLRNAPGMIRHKGDPSAHSLPTGSSSAASRWCRRGASSSPRSASKRTCASAARPARGSGRWSLDEVYTLFPILRERRQSPGTALSGGQQQMVAIGRALMSNPELLLCDEISLGLAPVVIRDIYAALPAIRATGAAVILVEQDIARALSVADRVCCMMEGRVTLTAPARDVTREAIHAAYFGAAA